MLRDRFRSHTVFYRIGVVRSWTTTVCHGTGRYGELGGKLRHRYDISDTASCDRSQFVLYLCFRNALIAHIYQVSGIFRGRNYLKRFRFSNSTKTLSLVTWDAFVFRIYLPETRNRDPSEVSQLLKLGFKSEPVSSPTDSSITDETLPTMEQAKSVWFRSEIGLR